mgnify:FL=1
MKDFPGGVQELPEESKWGHTQEFVSRTYKLEMSSMDLRIDSPNYKNPAFKPSEREEWLRQAEEATLRSKAQRAKWDSQAAKATVYADLDGKYMIPRILRFATTLAPYYGHATVNFHLSLLGKQLQLYVEEGLLGLDIQLSEIQFAKLKEGLEK